ncbi:type VI secretion system contractile sheath domain-containing protein [Pseudomaricurvus sp.]|uniref:type VI secretion system contractile sheath domain-containing protein n=1 Tax=Pseudomaricurvus sp. TaxID=2004510 RepID=UPI003F6C42CD
MSRTSINTGSTVFHASSEESSPKPVFTDNGRRLKVAILGDFSGRKSRGEFTPEDILNRPSYVVNKDNFELAFSRFNIRLQLPICDAPISFMEFDDLHPDYLYSRVPMFQKFIELNKKLLNPEQFEQAANEIQHWLQQDQQSVSADASAVKAQSSESILESILSNISHNASETQRMADSEVNRLINSIVAPYLQQPEDPRQADLLDAVTQATSQTMRSIMHHSAFQELEASWRSVQMLIKRLDLDSSIQIHLIDITKEELLADLQQADDDLEQAQIFHRLVSSQSAEGESPYNLVLGDFYLGESEEDLGLIVDMGTIAESTGSSFISGASSALAGFPSLAGPADPREWQYSLADDFISGWEAVQDYSGSQHVVAASPRFMLRLPYGKSTSTTDCFDFEELGEDNSHRYYLWGNSGYLVTLLLCQHFLEGGSDIETLQARSIEDLALHHYQDANETYLKPCAETLLTDTAAQEFIKRGLCTVRSVQQQDKVVIPQLNSLHFSGKLPTPWA